jgi:hypothetical protein
LDYTPKGQDVEYYEPIEEMIELDGQKVKCTTYTVNEQFGRSLLSAQPERYFLLEPKSLFIRKYDDNKLGSTTIKIISILEPEMGLQPKIEESPAPSISEINEDTFKPIEVQTAKEAFEIHHAENFKEETVEASKPKTPRAPKNPLIRPEL